MTFPLSTIFQTAFDCSRVLYTQLLHSNLTGLLLFASVYTEEREKREKLHYVHSASLAHEDGSVFMFGPFGKWL